MCGVCGIYHKNGQAVDANRLKRMSDRMVHRGPDDEGTSIEKNIGIAMRRLSIIDVDGGKQPISNEDGSTEVVMNGEIYNYVELRDELSQKGHQFKTKSDTEVLVHLYEEYGKGMVRRLNGMFVFIVWDKKKQELWIVRDRLGIKPLYYYRDKTNFLCSSDLQSLKQALPGGGEVSKEGFLSYVVLGYVPVKSSIYSNIQKLPPAHWISVTPEHIDVQKYWFVDMRPGSSMDFEEAQGKLNHYLKDAIRLQKRSDVPVGTFLSGGIDSSAVVAYLAQQNEEPVRTLTVDFMGKSDSEAPFARMVSDRYKTEHFENKLEFGKMAGLLQELIPFLDEPIADSAIIPSYYLSKLARQNNIKVLLNGTGGDELFGGYLRHHPYQAGSKYWFVKKLPPFLRRSISLLLEGADPHLAMAMKDEWCYWGTSISGVDLGILKNSLKDPKDFDYCMNVLKEHFGGIFQNNGEFSYYKRMKNDLQNYLVGDVLSLLDKTTMACSIEGRVPLLDHRIVEFAYRIPENVNIYHNQGKGLFKQVLDPMIPRDILNRKKVGFNAPVSALVNNYLRKDIKEMIASPNGLFKELIDMGKLRGILNRQGPMSARTSETLFSLYIFDQWYKGSVN